MEMKNPLNKLNRILDSGTRDWETTGEKAFFYFTFKTVY